MALKDIFKNKKAEKKEAQKNMDFLRYLLYMAVSDEKLDETEFNLIQEVMLNQRGMSREQTVKEIRKMMIKGFSSKVRIPETHEEKQELFRFLTSVMLMDQKIEEQEWKFLTMVVKALFKVKEKEAHQLMDDMVEQLLATGEYHLDEWTPSSEV